LTGLLSSPLPPGPALHSSIFSHPPFSALDFLQTPSTGTSCIDDPVPVLVNPVKRVKARLDVNDSRGVNAAGGMTAFELESFL
jgi:hypothetical protein